MCTWKDTVIKTTDIQWKRPKIKTIEDGKLDFILTLPFTKLFESQASHSYFYGMLRFLNFVKDNKGQFEVENIAQLFEDCGYPDFAKKLLNRVK